MSDPVADALRAAETAAHDAMVDRRAPYVAIAAATIAAFLRCYKGAWERGMPAYLLPDDGADLAAAVERAAREGRDG